MSSQAAGVGRKSGFWVAAAVFVAALVLRVAFLAMSEANVTEGDPKFYLEIAENLRAGEGYREGHLLAYRPPAFPAFIAGVQSLFGEELLRLRLAQSVLGALLCVLILALGWRLGGLRVGVLAAGFAACYPPLVRISSEILSENLFLCLLLGALYCLLRSRDGHRLPWQLGAGVLFGLAALTREVGLVVLLATLIWQVLERRSLSAGLANWAMVLITCLLVVSPWTVRNYQQFERLVPVSTNGGINFYMGNNPQATGEFRWAIAPGARWNQPSPKGALELEAGRLGFEAGLEFIESEPLRFVSLSLKRAWIMLGPAYAVEAGQSAPELIYRLVWFAMYCALFAFGLVGALFLLASPYRNPCLLLYLAVLALMAPHVITVANPRYQLPIVPLLVLLSAMAVEYYVLRRRSDVGLGFGLGRTWSGSA